jgi:surfactin synthase thioesterase subunit
VNCAVAGNASPRDVIAFPGAGGFGGEFRALRGVLDTLPGDARFVALQYPGRGGANAPAASFDDLVAKCAARSAEAARPRPVLLGHSFGALVAYATAVALEAAGTGVGALVAVGADAPDRVTLPVEAAASREAARAYLDSIGDDILGRAPDDEWREIIVDTAWRDLVLLTGFPGPAPVKLRCPVLAVRGRDDRITADDRMAAWADTTEGGFDLASLPGGHTDMLSSPEFLALVSAVVASGATDLPDRAPATPSTRGEHVAVVTAKFSTQQEVFR